MTCTAHTGYGVRALDGVPEDAVEECPRGIGRVSQAAGARRRWRLCAAARRQFFFGSGFIWSSGNVVGEAVKGVKSGVSVKQSVIGVAVASIWFIGGRPSISSIVRSMLVWLYCVLTTALRLV